MRIIIATTALALALPLFGSNPASAFFWDGDGYRGARYSYYGPERRYRTYRHYRSNERAERYRTGSNRWWRSMDYDNRGGRR